MASTLYSAPQVLITGAGGFVGRRLVTALKARQPSWKLHTPSAGKDATESGGLDVSDPAAVAAWVRANRPDVVVHLAAIAAVTASVRDPRLAFAVNFNGTLNLVLALQEHAPDAHLLYISSAEVYGASFRSGRALDESALLQPTNPYAASKAAADMVVRQAAENGLSATVMRPFNHTGPGQTEAFVVSNFAGQIARIEAGLQPPVLSVGALDDERDFLDVEDVVNAYVLALQHRDRIGAGDVFNVASGSPVRVGEILDRLLAKTAVSITTSIDHARLRQASTPSVAGDSASLRRTLGWAPSIPLDDTLTAVLEQRRAHWKA